MFIYIARLIVVIAGPVIGYLKISNDSKGILIGTAAAVLVIGIEIIIQKVRLDDMVAGALGLILGLIVASLIKYTIPALIESPRVNTAVKNYSLLLSIVFGYIGMIIALRKKGELDLLDKEINITGKRLIKGLKVVDSSALIDSRLLDIIETGFVEGIIIIPSFIIGEIQATADSPDEENRKKGRRALDILNQIKESEKISVKIYEKEYPEIKEVDAKLIKLCQEIRGKLITCDFNLNKAARAQGLEVLNINELANAVKPKLLPGEAVEIFILKKGKEKDQGVGFLEDGTMVVVEDGKNYIGQRVEVTVSSVLQKPSGRMIFARVS
ncbi:MAG: PIN/TRAM domain-containing protein [Elusimicrobiota bacterium]